MPAVRCAVYSLGAWTVQVPPSYHAAVNLKPLHTVSFDYEQVPAVRARLEDNKWMEPISVDQFWSEAMRTPKPELRSLEAYDSMVAAAQTKVLCMHYQRAELWSSENRTAHPLCPAATVRHAESVLRVLPPSVTCDGITAPLVHVSVPGSFHPMQRSILCLPSLHYQIAGMLPAALLVCLLCCVVLCGAASTCTYVVDVLCAVCCVCRHNALAVGGLTFHASNPEGSAGLGEQMREAAQ